MILFGSQPQVIVLRASYNQILDAQSKTPRKNNFFESVIFETFRKQKFWASLNPAIDFLVKQLTNLYEVNPKKLILHCINLDMAPLLAQKFKGDQS